MAAPSDLQIERPKSSLAKIFGCGCARSPVMSPPASPDILNAVPPSKHLRGREGMAASNSIAANGDASAMEDLWNADSVTAAGQFPEHLIIMVNGIVGSASNWRYAAEQFVKRLPDEVVVHCSERNAATLTFDGVDVMGNRLAEEVKKVIESKPGVKKISFIGHSLGGLVARYAIGVLFEPLLGCMARGGDDGGIVNGTNADSEKEMKGKIAGLEPINFITVATPHLGSRGHGQLPFLCGFQFLEKAASQSAHWFVGRTGRHLFLTDKDDGKPPLLYRMVTDDGDLRFISALRSFKRRVAYANIHFDHMVGWQTSSIRHHYEKPKLEKASLDSKYPHIVNIEEGNVIAVPRAVETEQDNVRETMEEEMISKLTQVPWERVDVSFQGSTQRFLAHSTIQVKWTWMKEGRDVILHMIDNFVV